MTSRPHVDAACIWDYDLGFRKGPTCHADASRAPSSSNNLNQEVPTPNSSDGGVHIKCNLKLYIDPETQKISGDLAQGFSASLRFRTHLKWMESPVGYPSGARRGARARKRARGTAARTGVDASSPRVFRGLARGNPQAFGTGCRAPGRQLCARGARERTRVCGRAWGGRGVGHGCDRATW